ncbi:chromate resistance protein ChrB domain-containing protein [Caballeronia grimmiae]|uniref:chromate resistance protein ChrB domain-containing protein n=1 Tax=Caballeronia grimmiae TaxID=1071679 RepID=UPI0038B74BFD
MNSQNWFLLVLTFPTHNATARMRFWRALKARGCAVLRDGAYLLPSAAAEETELLDLVRGIDDSGGSAHLLRVVSRDDEQGRLFETLFDRTEEYDSFVRGLAESRKNFSGLPAAEVERLLRRTRKEYDAVLSIDFFPNEAGIRAEAAWQDFVALADTILSPGEPHSTEATIRSLRQEDYQSRTWATRQRLWVDRVASAWLIRRFIDAQPRFVWLSSPAECPKEALGFDFDGAAFTHIGERVTFEVLVASFGLEEEPGLIELGKMVHALDIGGPAVPEAIGFEAVMAGAKQRGLKDDDMLSEMSFVLDSLLAHFAANAKTQGRGKR